MLQFCANNLPHPSHIADLGARSDACNTHASKLLHPGQAAALGANSNARNTFAHNLLATWWGPSLRRKVAGAKGVMAK